MARWRHAFSLSKTEVKLAIPPGTVTLLATQHEVEDGGSLRSGHNILKFPIPSSDPADPLNWPAWRKISVLLVAAVYAFTANFTSSIISPALSIWYSTFPEEPKPYPDLVHLIAVHILMLGAANIWWVPLSNWAGRRPILLVATLLMTLCSMWAGLATSFNSVLAARAFQGIGGSPADTVAPALVGEIFFLHERGRAMAVYTVALCAGSLIGGVVGGYVGTQLSWAYLFWISTAVSGFCFVGVALLVPETMYFRKVESLEATDLPSRDSAKEEEVVHTEVTVSSPAENYRPYTFIQSLGFPRPQPSHSLLRHFLQPWATLALPGTWVVMLHYGGLVGGIVAISVMGPQLVSQPPYNWGANSGLINIGALLGTLLGGLYTYVLSDAQLKRHAKKDGHGHAEPEARLPTLFPALFLSTGGFFVFGFCAQNPGPGRWVGLQVGYGMIAFGLMQVPSIGFNYIIDAYKHLAVDCFVVITILRAIISFSWTFFVADWIERSGAAEAFGIFGMLMGIFSLLTIPLWLFGKRMRIATAPFVEAED